MLRVFRTLDGAVVLKRGPHLTNSNAFTKFSNDGASWRTSRTAASPSASPSCGHARRTCRTAARDSLAQPHCPWFGGWCKRPSSRTRRADRAQFVLNSKFAK